MRRRDRRDARGREDATAAPGGGAPARGRDATAAPGGGAPARGRDATAAPGGGAPARGRDARVLRAALRRATPDDDDGGARERSWRVVQAAFAAQPARPPRRRRWAWLIVLLALTPVAAGGAAAASAPHSDIGRWVRGVLGVGERNARPVLGSVPGGGKLLVQAGASSWVVSSDGAKRRLGAYSGTSWSPNGQFVVGWRGRELTALEPGGTVRWSLSPRERVRSARWGPVDGFRIAYIAGGALRIVNGDGSGDRRYGAARAAVAPAWRPDGKHVLAYVDTQRRIRVVAVDSRTRLWRSPQVADLRALTWSPGGRRLLAVTGQRLLLFDGKGRLLVERAIPSTFVVTAAQWSPRGGDLAIVRYSAPLDRGELVLADAARGLREKLLFTGGRLGAPAWSPQAGRLLLPWPDADQWLFLRPYDRARTTAVANIAGQFGPGRLRPAFPRAVQWCC